VSEELLSAILEAESHTEKTRISAWSYRAATVQQDKKQAEISCEQRGNILSDYCLDVVVNETIR